jgi:hypothetical protein
MPATLDTPAPAETTAAAPEAKPDAKAEFRAALAAANARGEDRTADKASEEIPGDDDASQATETTAEEQVATVDETAPVETASVEETKPAGPSREWLQFALEQNVPRELLSLARDDKQVEEYVLAFGAHEGVEDEPAKAATPALEFKLPISDEDFDATDPVHVSLKALAEVQSKAIADLKAEIATIRGATGNLVQERQMKETIAREQDYDTALDALGLDALGKSGSDQRKAAWATFVALEKALPNVPRAEVAKRAALSTFPDLVAAKAKTAQLDALKTQQQQTIGGGPAKPAPKHEPTPKEKFHDNLRAAFERAKLREAGK